MVKVKVLKSMSNFKVKVIRLKNLWFDLKGLVTRNVGEL